MTPKQIQHRFMREISLLIVDSLTETGCLIDSIEMEYIFFARNATMASMLDEWWLHE